MEYTCVYALARVYVYHPPSIDMIYIYGGGGKTDLTGTPNIIITSSIEPFCDCSVEQSGLDDCISHTIACVTAVLF